MKRILTLTLACLLAAGQALGEDSFQSIKQNLARAGCHYFEFYSIIESNIFDQIDTAVGTAYISSDGRYNITVADENYVFDLKSTYTYSESTGQVIIQKMDNSVPEGEEISFILNLDETYNTVPAAEKNSYRLFKRESGSTAYPDSLLVEINPADLELKQFEYFDVNEELNRIEFLKYDYRKDCDSTLFEPVYPDSAEVIRL